MTNLDELFASAKRNGIGVLVINDLHIGDRVTAENVAGGDINASRNLTIPRDILTRNQSMVPYGESGTCQPLSYAQQANTYADPWAWRYNDLENRSVQGQRDYAERTNQRWDYIKQAWR
jgi:hypothetical protein